MAVTRCEHEAHSVDDDAAAAIVDAAVTLVQVVSELGELGHREGEALTKIDSLGFQLANLLDPTMSFDVSERCFHVMPCPALLTLLYVCTVE